MAGQGVRLQVSEGAVSVPQETTTATGMKIVCRGAEQ